MYRTIVRGACPLAWSSGSPRFLLSVTVCLLVHVSQWPEGATGDGGTLCLSSKASRLPLHLPNTGLVRELAKAKQLVDEYMCG